MAEKEIFRDRSCIGLNKKESEERERKLPTWRVEICLGAYVRVFYGDTFGGYYSIIGALKMGQLLLLPLLLSNLYIVNTEALDRAFLQ